MMNGLRSIQTRLKMVSSVMVLKNAKKEKRRLIPPQMAEIAIMGTTMKTRQNMTKAMATARIVNAECHIAGASALSVDLMRCGIVTEAAVAVVDSGGVIAMEHRVLVGSLGAMGVGHRDGSKVSNGGGTRLATVGVLVFMRSNTLLSQLGLDRMSTPTVAVIILCSPQKERNSMKQLQQHYSYRREDIELWW